MKKRIFFIKVLSLLIVSFFMQDFAFAEEIDITPPSGTILINDGALYTNNKDVILTLSADDMSGVLGMRIANHNSYHDLEPYVTLKNWELTNGDGLKTVRVKFKDQVGNENVPGISATIILDTIRPVISLMGDLIINLNIGDSYEDAGATALDNGITDLISDIEINNSVDTLVAGTYTITYDVSDSVGNNAVQATRTVNVIDKATEEQPTLSSISITNPATKLDYNIGEILDFSGVEVTGTYTDGSTKIETITINDISGFDSSSIAVNQVLSISINGINTTYTVNINNFQLVPFENITILNGDIVIYNGTILLPDAGTIDILGHQVNTQSVLGILYVLDQKDDTFEISNLSYNESFESYLLNCITPLDSESLCYNWQYVVNGNFPYVGMDKNIIVGNKSIYLFFGQANRLLLSKNSINKSESFVATAQKYDYENNVWLIRNGVTAGVVQTNPDDLYNPIEIQIGMVDVNGEIVFSSLSSGVYGVGIKDDFYWPLENITVINNISGRGGGNNDPKDFSIENALSFLLENQNDDGSFNNSLYTDWVAIGVAEAGDDADELKSKLKNYLKNEDFEALSITDYERHAMALMALGINPYTGTDVNYIQKIVDSFDGEQIGDESLFNDDIFGLIVLQNAGYNKDDEIISKTVSYIISQQSPSGSWGSVDMTVAGIEALYNLKDLDNVSDSISKAFDYLINSQSTDGGFENSSSTSWAIQAMSLDNSFYDAEIDNALGYLALKQQNDGGVIEMATDSIDTRIWETAYVIPAVLKMPWKDIINSFTKIETQTSSDQKLDEKEEGKITEGIETQIISENQVLTIQKTSEIVLPEIKKVSNPKVVVKDTTPEKKTVDAPELSNNVDLDNNLLASAGSVNLGNFFKDKVIMMTIILTLVTFIGGWFVIKS